MIKLQEVPLVSVVMPAYNAEEYIQESIQSVLTQTYRNFELIIINDASNDSTKQIIDSFTDSRINCIDNKVNMGVAHSLNPGINRAKGKYIMRLDSDDIAYSNRMETQVNYLENHENVYVLGCGMRAFGYGMDEYDMIPACSPEQLKIDSLFFCPISHPSVMFRKRLVEEGFEYNPAYERIEDYELWVRIMRKYVVGAISDVLVRYRIHSNQVTRSHTDEINSAVVRLHKRQMNEMSVFIDDCSYIQKSFDIEGLKKKIDIFNQMLSTPDFITYYNKRLCEEHFYMTIRNELFVLSCDKQQKEKILRIVGKKWNISNRRVLLDGLRLLIR